jgi:restriction endonuclease S subunit
VLQLKVTNLFALVNVAGKIKYIASQSSCGTYAIANGSLWATAFYFFLRPINERRTEKIPELLCLLATERNRNCP